MIQKNSVFTSGESDSDKMGRFVGGGSVAIASSVIGGLFAFAWTILMTRLLGKDDYGILDPYLKTFWISTGLICFGLPPTMMTLISQYHQNDFDTARRIASEGNRLLTIIGAVFCVVAAILFVVLKSVGMIGNLLFVLSMLMIFAIISRQMFLGVHASMTGIQRMDIVGLISISFSFMLPATSVVFLIIVRRIVQAPAMLKEMQIVAGAAGISASAFIAWLLSLIVSKRSQLPPRVMYSWKEKSPAETKRILLFGIVTFFALGAYLLLQLLPSVWFSYVMTYGFHWFKPADAGIFGAASTYAMAPALVIGLTFALIPAMSEAQEHGNRVLMNRYFNVSLRYCFALVAMITAFYAACAGNLVSFVTGGNYSAVYMQPITLYLEIFTGVTNLFFLLLSMIVGLKRPGVVAVVAWILVVFQVAAMTVAGKIGGSIQSVACGLIAVIVIGIAVLLFYLIKYVKLKLAAGLFIPPIIAASASWAVARAIVPEKGAGFVAVFIIVPAMFFVLEGFLGGIDGEDLDIIRQTLGSLRLGFASGLINLAERVFSISPLFKKKGAVKPDV